MFPLLLLLFAADWPQWRGEARDNTWSVKGLPARLPNELTPRWRVPVGGGYGGISVREGRVYLMDRQKSPREVERVLCLDAATGKSLWVHSYSVAYRKLDYGNGPRCTPTVHGGMVYTLGALGHLHCLDAMTGKVVWMLDSVKTFNGKVPTWGLACSPLVEGGRLIVLVGGKPGACLVALDLKTGEEAWRALEDRPGYASPVIIGEGKSRQLAYFTPQHIVGLDPATGKVRWKEPFEGIQYDVSITDPVMADGIVLAGNYWSGSKALKLDANGLRPEVAWEGKALSLLMCTPLVSGKYFYALDRFKGLKCIEAASGKILWENEHVTPRGTNPHASMAWVGNGRALILNTPGELLLVKLSPERIEYQGKAKIIGKTWAHAGFGAGCVFARDDSEIVCVPLVGK